MMLSNKSSQSFSMKCFTVLPLVIPLVIFFGNSQVYTNLQATTNITMFFVYQEEDVSSIDTQLLSQIDNDSTSNPSLKDLLQDAQAEDLPIYINGILTTKKSNSISVDEIASINVLKGLKAKLKYGEAATNGVVEIQLIEGASLFLKDLNIPTPEETFTPDFKIKAFHDPTKQEITLYFDGEAIPTSLKISKLYGRTIYKEHISSFDGFYNKTISLGYVTKGTLIIQFKQGGKTVEEKVIVE